MKKFIFTLILALLGGACAWAEDYDFSAVCSTGQTLYYKIIDDNAHTVKFVCPGFLSWNGYQEPTGEIEFPEMVEHNGVAYSVTEFSKHAFYGCDDLTGSLNIPGTITIIGERAFYGCKSFTGSLTIPNSVTFISDYAFDECSGFTGSLTIPNSVTTIASGAFAHCIGFTGSLTIGNSVSLIGAHAFRECSGFTGSLIIPNSVTTIELYAFQGCSGFTGSLSIPNSVTEIGDSAFRECIGFDGTLNIPNTISTISDWAFQGCSGFTGTLSIPNSVTEIGDSAFRECSGFTGSLNIPNTVTSIGEWAFQGCSGFTGSLSIPNSVTSINWCTFADCTGFNGSLIIGSSVTTIDYQAFNGCSGFTSIISKTQTPPEAYWRYSGISEAISVYVPCGNSEAYSQDEEWSFFTNFHEFKPYDIALFSSDETMGSVAITQLPDCETGICKVKATPFSGYQFDYWMENGVQVSTETEYSFEATADRTLTAYFSETLNVNSFAEPEVQLFPNPANDVLNVVCDGMRHITIMNTLGQVVYDAEPADVQSAQISLAGFDAGVYIVRIATDYGMTSKSVVKAEL